MKKLFALMLILFFSLYLVASKKKKTDVFNTTSEYSSLCEESDMYGLWKVVRWIPYFEVKGKMWESPAFMKNQWFEFDGKGGMKSLATNLKMKLDKVRRKMSEASFSVKIKSDKKGFFLLFTNDSKKNKQTWRCSIVKKNMIFKDMYIELKKGDLIMTHLGEDNNILYFRQLRRVEEEGDE